ncbi:MAG: hypothetical protein ACJAZ2_000888 [Glaciecola sp.]|jgi:hypothetical protein
MKYLGYFALIVVLLSCSKEEEEENVEPVLTFESMTPVAVTELVEEIVIKFKYSDNDGNLGENDDPDVTNLFITDSRNQVVNSFRVKQLAPDNSTIAIEGTLSVTINPLLITDGSTNEKGTFSIYMNDRAGNKSNVIISSEFTVSK